MTDRYRPPPRHACQDTIAEVDVGVYCGVTYRVVLVIWTYRGQVRDFEIGLWAVIDDVKREIASVDCCDSEIHVHRLARSSPTDRQRDRRRLITLGSRDAAIVNDEHLRQYDWMLTNWEALARSWDEH